MRVFLTGATGLLGGALAGALLDAGHEVIALVRGEGRRVLDMDGCDRAGDVLQLQGDVALPGFGQPADVQPADCVIHCAAITDFTATDTTYKSVNISGARHAGELALRWGVPLVHVSTSYVCGTRDGVVAEAPPDADGPFTNGYEASKAHSEIALLAMRHNGLQLAIARPSIILGRLSDGAIARQDDFYHLFRLFGSPFLGPVPADTDAAFAVVPIDHVVAGILAMAQNFDRFEGRIAHLVAAEPFAMAEMLRIVGEYPNTVPARMVSPDAFAPVLLDRRQIMVHRKIGSQFFAYFLRAPQFVANTLEERTGIPAPHVDEAAFRRMIDYCVKVGFLDWR
jgi:nucleoside-diphosphate-sugar epimerase